MRLVRLPHQEGWLRFSPDGIRLPLQASPFPSPSGEGRTARPDIRMDTRHFRGFSKNETISRGKGRSFLIPRPIMVQVHLVEQIIRVTWGFRSLFTRGVSRPPADHFQIDRAMDEAGGSGLDTFMDRIDTYVPAVMPYDLAHVKRIQRPVRWKVTCLQRSDSGTAPRRSPRGP